MPQQNTKQVKEKIFHVPAKRLSGYPSGGAFGPDKKLSYKINKEVSKIKSEFPEQKLSFEVNSNIPNQNPFKQQMRRVVIRAYENKKRGTPSSAQRKPVK
jgi:hypothetical protein